MLNQTASQAVSPRHAGVGRFPQSRSTYDAKAAADQSFCLGRSTHGVSRPWPVPQALLKSTQGGVIMAYYTRLDYSENLFSVGECN